MSSTRILPVVLRLLAFFGVAIALAIYAIGLLGFDFGVEPRRSLEAEFDDATGVLVGSEVVVSGVVVGKVRAIELEREHLRARIAFDVPVDLPLANDARVVVRTRSLLGEKLVWLEPGTPGQSALVGARVAAAVEPDLFSLARNAGALGANLEALTAEATRALAALDAASESLNATELAGDLHAVGSLARRLDAALGDPESSFSRALGEAEAAGQALGELATQVRPVVERTATLLDRAEESAVLERIAQAAARLEAALDEITTELTPTLVEVRRTLGGEGDQAPLGDDVRRALAAIESLAESSSSTVASLGTSSTRLSGTLDKLDAALDNLGEIDLRALRRLLQEEGVRVRLLDE